MPSNLETATAKPAPWSPRISLGAAFALLAGLAIAWLDTRPGWDDTAISAGALFISAGVAGLVGAPWWLAGGLAVAPMLIAELGGNKGVLLALPIAFAGAIAGAFLRRLAQRR